MRGILISALATSVLASQDRRVSPTPQAVRPGVLVPRQICLAQPDQSYALYVPSHYVQDKRWPIVYAFDPAGRGNLPVELLKDAAERYGYILLGSNNSRNGSWKMEAEAAQAMNEDSHALLAIDDRRVYFAGFSGGARVASEIAQRCKCAAGVILNGAGFSAGASPSRGAVFAVFAAVGDFDFNYPEVADLDEKLEQAGFPHLFRPFEGSHEWAPADVMDEALAWFRLVAMKQNREPRDNGFVDTEKSKIVARANVLEQSGNFYAAWREYRQAVATFDELTDTTSLRQAAGSLEQQKAVRDSAKREIREFQEQDQLTREIFSGLAALRNTDPSRSDILSQTSQEIIDLRTRVASEKHQDKVRVFRRALTGIFVTAMEAGEERLDAKDGAVARDYFEFASDAEPDSVWALSSLARARAFVGDRKGTFDALRRAKENSKDVTTFTAWLKAEPAFAKLREDPKFRSLLTDP